MSTNRLDTVKTFDQFGHDQWKALGTKLGGVEAVKAVLRGTSIVSVDVIHRLSELKKGVVLPARIKRFVPKTAFKTRKGRWSSSNMNEMVLPLAKPLAKVPEIRTGYRNLKFKIGEWDMMDEYPKSIYRDVSKLLAHVDGLVALQPNGEPSGDLLVENYAANLFFLVPDENKSREGFVVSAGWYSNDGEWFFHAIPLGGCVWNAGDRVFSDY